MLLSRNCLHRFTLTDSSLMPAGLLDKLGDRDIADLYGCQNV
jgi:hypothetical protein